MTARRQSPATGPFLPRRGFLGLAVGGAAGAAAAIALPVAAAQGSEVTSADAASDPVFHGRHQAGIATPAQGHATLVAFSLRTSTDREALGRLLRSWTSSAAALTAGRPAPGDPTPSLALPGSRLTITVGVGTAAIEAAGRGSDAPDLTIPNFGIDRLQRRWSGGDLVIQVGAQDSTTVHHAVRTLARDAEPFATALWRQSGFNGARPDGAHRNLMGQVEGTGNTVPGNDTFDDTVWATTGPDWLIGGTTMAVRRITMALDRWDTLPPVERDKVIGRRTSDGAPRGRTSITDPLDFDLLDTEGPSTHVHGNDEVHVHDDEPTGLAIPEDAHVRRAHASFNEGRRIFRRGYSYADHGDEGLIFIAFQKDIDAFVGIQRSLARVDALNRWTTPIGSAAFAMLPGCESGDWLGRALIEG